ncbi:MAG: ABC transporter substrate-binding protein [Clostridia bacterium]|nr:ABC transporter substrate-binding protein [Clostridia bacterium]
MKHVNLRRLLASLLALCLALGCVSALAENEDIEGDVVIYTSMYPFMIDQMTETLKEEFPNLNVNFFYGGTGDLQTKLAGEMGDDLKGRLSCDMLLVAEPSYSLELKEYGYLEPVEIDQPEEKLRFEYDPEGYWYPVRTLNMVLAYNPEKYSLDEVPTTYRAFAEDESLKGQISMSNPLTSGTAMAAVTALSDKYGYDYFTALGRNGVMIESGSTALAKLQTGECKAIMILEESVLRIRKEESSPISVIYPDDGVILVPSTVMTIAENKSANANLEACEAVTNWLLSEAGQKCILSGYMHSVLKGMDEFPYDSVSTDSLIEKDMGVDWNRCYQDREEIRARFQEAVTLP